MIKRAQRQAQRRAQRQALRIWIAMLAVLFGALAPTVSHALAAGGAAATLEICSVDGYKLVHVTDAGNADEKAPATIKHGMEHCAFCATHGGSVALPAASSLVFAIDAGRDLYPPLFYAAPRTPHAWSTANPRAPPRHS